MGEVDGVYSCAFPVPHASPILRIVKHQVILQAQDLDRLVCIGKSLRGLIEQIADGGSGLKCVLIQAVCEALSVVAAMLTLTPFSWSTIIRGPTSC